MDQPHQIFTDLLNVEVNTIVKHSMTAAKMPTLPFALLDIAQLYGEALARFGVDTSHYMAKSNASCWAAIAGAKLVREDSWSHETEQTTYERACVQLWERDHGRGGKPSAQDLFNYALDLWPALGAPPGTKPPKLLDVPTQFPMAGVRNGWDTFERLRIAAHEAIENIHDDQDRVITSRIISSCSHMKYVVQRLQQHPEQVEAKRSWMQRDGGYAQLDELIPKTRRELLSSTQRGKRIPQPLTPEELAFVRKAWEVGCESVVAQTVVQLDGDVVTRISDRLLDGTFAAHREAILAAHQRSIDMGLEHWRSLVQVAIDLVTKVLRALAR